MKKNKLPLLLLCMLVFAACGKFGEVKDVSLPAMVSGPAASVPEEGQEAGPAQQSSDMEENPEDEALPPINEINLNTAVFQGGVLQCDAEGCTVERIVEVQLEGVDAAVMATGEPANAQEVLYAANASFYEYKIMRGTEEVTASLTSVEAVRQGTILAFWGYYEDDVFYATEVAVIAIV